LVVAKIGGIGAGQPALGFGQLDLVEQAARTATQPDPLGSLLFQPAPG
jgi:hypothetical protein